MRKISKICVAIDNKVKLAKATTRAKFQEIDGFYFLVLVRH